MDIARLIELREARGTRDHRPYVNYREAADQCVKTGEKLLKRKKARLYDPLLEQSIIINFVTHVEVYFRDILDAIFRICDPNYFKPKLKDVHNIKYNIAEVVEMFEKGIHPLELVSANCSFQNIGSIDRVFSNFLGRGFWATVVALEVKVPEITEKIITFEQENLNSLVRIFDLRHSLVHNPRADFKLNKGILLDIRHADAIMFAADIVISNLLGDNQDPALVTGA